MDDPRARFDLTGKVAVITGGTRGIGRAVAEGLAMAGADVVVASRKAEACDAAAAEIAGSTGRRTLGVACHVGEWDQCDQLVDTVYGEFGRCDVLVNNAGMSPLFGDDLRAVTEEYYDKVHAVNARGPFRLASLIGSRMAEGAGGSLISMSSTSSLHPNLHELPYGMAKAALNAMMLGLAGVWAPKVRSNVLIPGPYDTDIAKAWGDEARAFLNRSNPMGRIGVPDDMVGVCLFLASEASSYVNGAQILMDGGASRTL